MTRHEAYLKIFVIYSRCVYVPQAMVEGSVQRIANLSGQWEGHRAPLLQKIRELRQLQLNQEVTGLLKEPGYMDGLRLTSTTLCSG